MIISRIRLGFKYRVLWGINIIYKLAIKPPIVKSMDETINKIINENCSICRYGDGEFKVILAEGNGFQESNEKLATRLKEILMNDDENIIIGIPDVFEKTDKYKNNAQAFWEDYLIYNRFKIYKLINKEKIYYNAFVTRPYMDWKDKSKCNEWFSKLISIWDEREVVIIEGEGTRLGVGNELFVNAKSICRIIAPAQNAFRKYEEILIECKKINKNKLILIALGQTATVLTYDLSKLGYQAIDIGHFDIEYESNE